MDKEMHYVIYQITNLVNGKIYIGKHKTENLDDGYMGSGTLLKRAIEKYGIENFKKEILVECSSDEELFNKERELVNENFVARDDTYNLKVGGDGGFDYINREGLNMVGINMVNACGLNNSNNNNLTASKKHQFLLKTDNEYYERFCSSLRNAQNTGFKGKHHTDETKLKMSEKAKLRTGDKNSAFGKVWIHNDIVQRNLMIHRELVVEYLVQDWSLGRKMKYH